MDKRLADFFSAVRPKFKEKKATSNLLPFQHKLMAKLKNMNHIIIGKTDKGLGPFAIEFVRYIEDGLRLLSSPKHYQFLTPQEATNRAQHVQVSIFR